MIYWMVWNEKRRKRSLWWLWLTQSEEILEKLKLDIQQNESLKEKGFGNDIMGQKIGQKN